MGSMDKVKTQAEQAIAKAHAGSPKVTPSSTLCKLDAVAVADALSALDEFGATQGPIDLSTASQPITSAPRDLRHRQPVRLDSRVDPLPMSER